VLSYNMYISTKRGACVRACVRACVLCVYLENILYPFFFKEIYILKPLPDSFSQFFFMNIIPSTYRIYINKKIYIN